MDPDGKNFGWIQDKNGTVFWDKNTNSEEDFKRNYADKTGFSYVSNKDNPNVYTLPNGEGQLQLNSWTEYDIKYGFAGVSIELEFIPSDKHNNCGWLQTFSSNIPDVSSSSVYELLPLENIEERIDFQNFNKNNLSVQYYNPSINSLILSDQPGRKLNEGTDRNVKWAAQSSVLLNGERCVTIGWGFSIYSNNSGAFHAPHIINPSKFHINTINLLK